MNTSLAKENVAGKNALILIVERNDALRASLREWISKTFPECGFLEAKTGDEAIYLASIHSLDIVLLDNNFSGWRSINDIKRIKNNSLQTRVIILSDYDYSVYKEEVMKAGADAFMMIHKIHCQLIPVLMDLLPY